MDKQSQKTQLLEFINGKSIAVVSTVTPQNKPMSATVYFVVDDNLNFYFTTKTFSRKYRNILENPNVSMVVGTDNEPVTAQIEGVAQKINDKSEFDRFFVKFHEIFSKNSYVAPIFQLSPVDNTLVMFKITPNFIRWLDLRGDKVDNDFVQIIP